MQLFHKYAKRLENSRGLHNACARLYARTMQQQFNERNDYTEHEQTQADARAARMAWALITIFVVITLAMWLVIR